MRSMLHSLNQMRISYIVYRRCVLLCSLVLPPVWIKRPTISSDIASSGRIQRIRCIQFESRWYIVRLARMVIPLVIPFSVCMTRVSVNPLDFHWISPHRISWFFKSWRAIYLKAIESLGKCFDDELVDLKATSPQNIVLSRNYRWSCVVGRFPKTYSARPRVSSYLRFGNMFSEHIRTQRR